MSEVKISESDETFESFCFPPKVVSIFKSHIESTGDSEVCVTQCVRPHPDLRGNCFCFLKWKQHPHVDSYKDDNETPFF